MCVCVCVRERERERPPVQARCRLRPWAGQNKLCRKHALDKGGLVCRSFRGIRDGRLRPLSIFTDIGGDSGREGGCDSHRGVLVSFFKSIGASCGKY